MSISWSSTEPSRGDTIEITTQKLLQTSTNSGGSIATAANGTYVGQTFYDTATKTLYVWNGTAWE